jgi:hypothetical protein
VNRLDQETAKRRGPTKGCRAIQEEEDDQSNAATDIIISYNNL